MGRFGLKRIDG